MYLGTLLLGAAMACTLSSVCYAQGICDEGPPGKFCFIDLSGYHDCVFNKTTGKIDDKLYFCPITTSATRYNIQSPKGCMYNVQWNDE
jgi:hypothetical protein